MTIAGKIRKLYERLQRAEQIVEQGLIHELYGTEAKGRWFVVKSHSGQTRKDGRPKLYLVTDGSCTCKDFQVLKEHNGGWCKHRLARELVLERKEGKDDPHGVPRKGDGNRKQAGRRGAGSAPGGHKRRADGAGSAKAKTKG